MQVDLDQVDMEDVGLDQFVSSLQINELQNVDDKAAVLIGQLETLFQPLELIRLE